MLKAPFLTILSVLLACAAGAADESAEPLKVADFEQWEATGNAFRKGPASGELLGKLEIENAPAGVVFSSEIEGDEPMGSLTSPPFTLSRHYLAFRIGGGPYELDTCLNLLVDGKVVKSATGWRSDALAPMSWNVSHWKGQSAQLQLVDNATGDWGHINVAGMVQTDAPERLPLDPGPLYHESLRPQFHFTARQWTVDRLNPGQREEGWINDLNGLIYYEGEYHLFAQRWAKCWLHAVSKDLVHWTELSPAFWEETHGSGVQSGTCVIDYKNTSGLSSDPAHPAMVAFWPRFDNKSQCISYSLDRGRSWQPYAKNPYMLTPERDPKVFWYQPGGHWVMMLYGNSQYHILTSKNLLDWHDEGHPVPKSFECPDFFELPIDGGPEKKWVLIQGNGNYSIGTFNGTEFKEESPRFPCDVGPNFYATQSWANTETGDGRRIQCAWMRGADFVDMPFSQMISFPCELSLHSTPGGLRVFRRPVREIEALQTGGLEFTQRTLHRGQRLLLAPEGQLFRVIAEFSIPEGGKVTFNIRGVPVVLTRQTLENGHRPASIQKELTKLELLIDRTSIEAFANDGEISSTSYTLPHGNGLSLQVEDGDITLQSLKVHDLKSAWPDSAP